MDTERLAEGLIDLLLEEGDLAFVIGLEVKKTVLFDSATGDALDMVDFLHWSISRRLAVMAEIVVGMGDIEMQEFGHGHYGYIVNQGQRGRKK